MIQMNLKSVCRVLMASLTLAFVVPVSTAFAQDMQTARDSIRQSQNRFEQLKIQDTSKYNSDVAQISSWIDEAQILINKNETEKVQTLSLKIAVYIDYLDASLERDRVLKGAIDAEAELKALKAEYGKMEAKVQQLSAEHEILSKKLAELNKK